jgi:hypothetical protein
MLSRNGIARAITTLPNMREHVNIGLHMLGLLERSAISL